MPKYAVFNKNGTLITEVEAEHAYFSNEFLIFYNGEFDNRKVVAEFSRDNVSGYKETEEMGTGEIV